MKYYCCCILLLLLCINEPNVSVQQTNISREALYGTWCSKDSGSSLTECFNFEDTSAIYSKQTPPPNSIRLVINKKNAIVLEIFCSWGIKNDTLLLIDPLCGYKYGATEVIDTIRYKLKLESSEIMSLFIDSLNSWKIFLKQNYDY